MDKRHLSTSLDLSAKGSHYAANHSQNTKINGLSAGKSKGMTQSKGMGGGMPSPKLKSAKFSK